VNGVELFIDGGLTQCTRSKLLRPIRLEVPAASTTPAIGRN
jgi:hypothetical protein